MTQPGRPAVFVHGLWLHASSWGPWLELFQEAGYTPAELGWPGDRDTVEEARRDPSQVAGKGIDELVCSSSGYSSMSLVPAPFGHAAGTMHALDANYRRRGQ
jgi:hypothetical protein